MRAKRNQEEFEREWRRKQKEEALKRWALPPAAVVGAALCV